MSLSYPQLQAIVEEVATLAVPSSLQRAYARDDRAVVLQLRGRGETRYLLLDPTAGSTRLHFVDAKPQQPQHPPSFVMLLRKHLVGAVLRDVRLEDDNRVVQLEFDKRIDDGSKVMMLDATFFGRVGKLDLRGIAGTDIESVENEATDGNQAPQASSDPLGLAKLEIGDRSAVIAAWYEQKLGDEARDRAHQDLRSALRSETKRAKRLVRNLQKDLDRVDEAAQYRRYGELLQSAYSLDVPRGAKFVMVPDYYAQGAPQAQIPLDPARNLKENIARYFHQYRRMSGAGDQIAERMLAAEEQLEQLLAARQRLDEIDNPDEVTQLHEQLVSDGTLRRRRPQNQRKAKKEAKPYRTFLARSGAKVLVGRGAKNNDVLTLRVARGRDVWLHARDWAGAHVVLRMTGDDEPRGEDLRDAALLAAHFSKGKKDTLVEVTHTRAKWVKKPKGAPAGLVTVGGGSTIAIRPADARLQELMTTEVFDD